MENYEAFVGFDLSKTPLSSIAQKIMSAMHSVDLVDSRNWRESEKTAGLGNKSSDNYSVLLEDRKNQSLDKKNLYSLTSQTLRASIKLPPHSSAARPIYQLSTDPKQKSISSLPPSSSLIPQCNPEASVLQKMEHTGKHFLKENINNENLESMNLKRKHIICNNSIVKTSKHMALGEDAEEAESYLNSRNSGAFKNHFCDIRYLKDFEKSQLIEMFKQATALVVTLVYKDGSTQLSTDQALSSSIKGIVVSLKGHEEECSGPPLDASASEGLLAEALSSSGGCIYIKVGHSPIWGKEHKAYHQFARKVLFQMLKGGCPVICFNAKDFVRTVLQFFGEDGSWKHVADFVGLDPRIAAWLIDPSDAVPSFEDLVAKYFEKPVTVQVNSTYGNSSGNTVTQNVCVNLRILYRLTMDLCSKLKVYGLWQLFCTLEIPLIPILAVMESHNIQINKEEMERTSVLLGSRLKELEQEAHFVAGEQFLITSSNQLREILFGKLKLHLLCEKKTLPKTVLQKHPSTSEAVLNVLQDFHPLPKIILEYRQVHKIKSTFVDGLLACMKKGFISSSWNQTGTVSGRLSAKHPEERSRGPRDVRGQGADQEGGVRGGLRGREGAACCLSESYCSGSCPVFGELLQKYKKIKDFAQATIAKCHQTGYVTSIMGRRRPLPKIRAQNQQLRAQAERQAVNFVLQGSAADLCKLAMVRVFAAVAASPTLTARLVAQIHDELLFEVEDSQIAEFAALVRRTMESSQHTQAAELRLQVPLQVSLSAGRSWGCLAPLPEAPRRPRSSASAAPCLQATARLQGPSAAPSIQHF